MSADSFTQSGPDIGVLLVNLGTPQAPIPRAVRRYLAQFLSDTRVIDYSRWLWLPLLHGVILPLRSRRSARAYAKIWTPQGSPLLHNSQLLTDKLTAELSGLGVRVALAMRYGVPSIDAVLQSLLDSGVRRVLLLPLYPQYSATSTASAFDAAFATLRAVRAVPEIRCIADYHVEPAYIAALAQSVEKYWFTHGRGERLVVSFHGIPQRYVDAGDPYHVQCLRTAQLLREQLGITEASLLATFQSRVGREAWLTPYTADTLISLAQTGVRHVQVLCPGFAVDCLETLEEIAIRGREQFLAAGGERLDYIPALNASKAHVDLLQRLIERHAQGWSANGG